MTTLMVCDGGIVMVMVMVIKKVVVIMVLMMVSNDINVTTPKRTKFSPKRHMNTQEPSNQPENNSANNNLRSFKPS